ncbi:hypothetical protein GCM10025867_11600 [Frondihabitans sucicola]|uniref:histidine kinase n=1 Tax=Frondihabitans sucicola TaxID=1268041 RepID=A0ABM8GKJ1_9MICO|nr:histidine kinase [Frondihabitans sucicola]BDZ48919.1 hypothetical protein GCM10025867_11600 [Frondihabitans sucicola]
MTGNRWWHALFATTMAVLVAVALVNLPGGTGDEYLALAAIGVLVAAYATFGRRGFDSQRVGFVMIAVLVVCSGAAVRVDPSMALIQCIAMPLIWCQLQRTRDAVVGNVVIVAVIALAMAGYLGPSASTVVQVVLIEGISLAGSIALGLWVSRLAELSAERARLLDELRRAQAEVEALGCEAGSTSERERWAREIHDTIAQSLTGLVMLGQRARRELAASSALSGAAPIAEKSPRAEGSALAETLELLEETARQALVETRSLVAATAPVDLGGGIAAALERLGRRFERETGIAVLVSVDDGLSSSTRGRIAAPRWSCCAAPRRGWPMFASTPEPRRPTWC